MWDYSTPFVTETKRTDCHRFTSFSNRNFLNRKRSFPTRCPGESGIHLHAVIKGCQFKAELSVPISEFGKSSKPPVPFS